MGLNFASVHLISTQSLSTLLANLKTNLSKAVVLQIFLFENSKTQITLIARKIVFNITIGIFSHFVMF